MTEFDGLVALVTGGASGIGAATAARLTECGARVAVLDRSIEGLSDEVFGVVCDITHSNQVDASVALVAERFGGIDIVINNAGIGAQGDVTANSDEEWHRVFDVNVVGLARVSRAALPFLRQSSHAVIVNTCSVVAIVGLANRALYSASKGAVASLTLAMAADHVRDGIRVNAVLPGTADTPWVARLLETASDPVASAAALRARQPMGRRVRRREPCSVSTAGWRGCGSTNSRRIARPRLLSAPREDKQVIAAITTTSAQDSSSSSRRARVSTRDDVKILRAMSRSSKTRGLETEYTTLVPIFLVWTRLARRKTASCWERCDASSPTSGTRSLTERSPSRNTSRTRIRAG
jgi:2-keto-3-deoxy-L-fuconate dehydrogenase